MRSFFLFLAMAAAPALAFAQVASPQVQHGLSGANQLLGRCTSESAMFLDRIATLEDQVKQVPELQAEIARLKAMPATKPVDPPALPKAE